MQHLKQLKWREIEELLLLKEWKIFKIGFNCSKKANCVLGMIKRNIKCKNAAFIMRLYKSLVRPRLKYCIQALSPYHKKDIEVLERVQNSATKMVYGYGDLIYKDRLSIS